MTQTKHTCNWPIYLVVFVAIQLATFGLGPMLKPAIAQEIVLRTVDGQQRKGTLERIDRSGRLVGAGLGDDLQLDSIVSIQTKQPIVSTAQPVQIYLVGNTAWGSAKVGASEISIDGETVSLAGRLGDFQLPLQAVQAIVWRDSKSVQQMIAKPSADTDRVVVDVGGAPQTVSGIVEGVSNTAVSLNYKGKLRSIGIGKVNAIVLADVGSQSPSGVLVSVATTEGSRLFGSLQSWGEDAQFSTVKLSIVKDTAISIKASQVAKIQIQSDRLLVLSSVDPVSVKESTDFVEPRSYQRNQSVTGGKLQIRGVDNQPITFNSGIGAQATSEITYANDKKFNRLLATVGIDWATQGRGDCQVVVKTDDIEVFNQQISGGSAPIELDIDIANADKVSLVVMPGRQFDLSDHVVWGDARLINTRNSK